MKVSTRRRLCLLGATGGTAAVMAAIVVAPMHARGANGVPASSGSPIVGICTVCIDLTGFNSTQISQLTLTQLSTITGTQLGGLTTTQLGGLTTTQLGALTSTQLGGFTGTQLGSLTTAQLTGLTGAQLSGLTASQLTGFTGSQLGSLSTTQLTGFTGSQLGSLTAAQLGGITPANLVALTPSTLSAIPSATIKQLPSATIDALVVPLNSCTVVQCTTASTNGFEGTITPAAGTCLRCDFIPNLTPQTVPTTFTEAAGRFLAPVGAFTFVPNTLSAPGPVTVPLSVTSTSHPTLGIDLGIQSTALPAGTAFSVFPGDANAIKSVASSQGLTLVTALAVGWQAPGGVSTAGSPLTLTVTDPGAKRGEKLYVFQSGALVKVDNATVSDGSWTVSFTSDPGFVLAQAAETSAPTTTTPPATTTPPPPTTTRPTTSSGAGRVGTPVSGGGPVALPSSDVEAAFALLALAGISVGTRRRRRSGGVHVSEGRRAQSPAWDADLPITEEASATGYDG